MRIKGKIKTILIKLGKFFLILLISFIFAEVGLRLFNHFNPIFIFYDDSYNRFRGQSFATDYNFKLNSMGFKDLEFKKEKQNSLRILGIGDSFVFGVVPYQYNYLTRLESQLTQKDKKTEVLNMGISCTGPPEYLSILVREGLILKPDMVILSFFVGNDFIESNRNKKKRKWYDYSYVASLIHYITTIRAKYKGKTYHKKRIYCDLCPTFDQKTYLDLLRAKFFLFKVRNKYFFRLLNDAIYHLTQIRDICKRKGIQLLVVIIPDEFQINHSLQAEVKENFYSALKKEEWDILQPNKFLSEKLKDLGIDFLDLYEYFAVESNKQSLYKPRDTHWNIAGNQLAADLIQMYIQKKYFLKNGN